MRRDWRIYRPAIWLAMLGIALILLVSPAYVGGVVVGGAIGIGLRIAFGRPPTNRARRQARQDGSRKKREGPKRR